EGVIHRIKPRYNPDVNDWWISNETRHSYKVVHAENRIRQAGMKRHGILEPASFNDVIQAARDGLRQAFDTHGAGSLFAVLSPMMASEEAWLLGQYIRSIDPQATLVLGPVPVGEEQVFRHYTSGEETFRIQ